MLTLVMAETELELVPTSIQNHPVVVKSARKRGKSPGSILLDSNFHHSAMRTLKDSERRGRPDIAHIALLCALESVLNKKGRLNLYIHTRNDDIIYVNPKTRIPRSYNRFCGVMEGLLEKGTVEDLLRVEKKSLSQLLEELPGEKAVMHREGGPFVIKEGMVAVVGGFPHGDFHTALPYKRYCIFGEELTAWTVVNEVMVRYELYEMEKEKGAIAGSGEY